MSADGYTLAVGGPTNEVFTTNSGPGSVSVFVRSPAGWANQARLVRSSPSRDSFGFALALSPDGDTLVIGAPADSSTSTRVNQPQTPQPLVSAGAAHVFRRTGTTWTEQAYVKASNAGAGDDFGGPFAFGLALSHDGATLAVGAAYEDSNPAASARAWPSATLEGRSSSTLRPRSGASCWSGDGQRLGGAVKNSGEPNRGASGSRAGALGGHQSTNIDGSTETNRYFPSSRDEDEAAVRADCVVAQTFVRP
jgi:hypothetical protein